MAHASTLRHSQTHQTAARAVCLPAVVPSPFNSTPMVANRDGGIEESGEEERPAVVRLSAASPPAHVLRPHQHLPLSAIRPPGSSGAAPLISPPIPSIPQAPEGPLRPLPRPAAAALSNWRNLSATTLCCTAARRCIMAPKYCTLPKTSPRLSSARRTASAGRLRWSATSGGGARGRAGEDLYGLWRSLWSPRSAYPRR